MTAYPDYQRAETAAYELLLAHPGPLPVRPLALLREVAAVVDYEAAAEQLGMSGAEFERLYGGADAFTVRQGGRSLVCCRMDASPTRRSFTLAHELGHVVLGHTGLPAQEREADHFASCLLLPEPVRRRLLARGDLAAEDAAGLCYLSVAAVLAAMRRRETAAEEALIGRLDALYGPQVDALKPAGGKALRHPLRAR